MLYPCNNIWLLVTCKRAVNVQFILCNAYTNDTRYKSTGRNNNKISESGKNIAFWYTKNRNETENAFLRRRTNTHIHTSNAHRCRKCTKCIILASHSLILFCDIVGCCGQPVVFGWILCISIHTMYFIIIIAHCCTHTRVKFKGVQRVRDVLERKCAQNIYLYRSLYMVMFTVNFRLYMHTYRTHTLRINNINGTHI